MNFALAAAARQFAEMKIDFGNPGYKSKDPHKIIPLLNPYGTPFGWAFVGFFDAKECIKSFCNHTGSITTLGDENFMPFNNLSVKWAQHSLVDNKLWVIRIDATMSATEGSFPMHCHVTWANKIARAVLSSDVPWEAESLEVLQPLLLTEAQTDDLESKFRTTLAIPIRDPHKIIPLLKSDGTPFGWAFVRFFDAKEWIKSFCNRIGSMTTLGDENFMPFNNLSVKWVQNSLVDDNLWVIRIDATMVATEGSFPMLCHVPWANKIARAILSSNVQWEAGSLEVLQPLLLTEAQTDDLELKFN